MLRGVLPPRLARLPRHVLPSGLVLLLAHGPMARLHGLIGCRPLPCGHALLLAPCSSVHTLGMRFALDLVWLDSRGAVLEVSGDVGPGRLAGQRGARAVVEAPAGEGAHFAAALRDAPAREP